MAMTFPLSYFPLYINTVIMLFYGEDIRNSGGSETDVRQSVSEPDGDGSGEEIKEKGKKEKARKDRAKEAGQNGRQARIVVLNRVRV